MFMNNALGRGAYEQAFDGESLSSVEHARNILLDCIRDSPNARQKVLDSLSGEPYRIFKETNLYYEADDKRRLKLNLGDRYFWTTYQRPDWRDIEDHAERLGDPVADFRKVMFEWSQHCCLDVTWFRARGYETLDLWVASSDAYDLRKWKHEPAWFPVIGGVEFKFEGFKRKTNYPQYGFRDEIKILMIEAFKRECSPSPPKIKLFEKKLSAFLADLEEEARKHGLSPVKRKRHSKKRVHRFEQFEWFVEHQINGKKYKYIAREYAEKYETKYGTVGDIPPDGRISEGVLDTATRIGLAVSKLRDTQGRTRPS